MMTGHRPFSIVLGGGGAGGFAHLGVLRALDLERLRPSGIVGVSMGAVMGGAFAHRSDWYEAVLALGVSAFPGPLEGQGAGSSGPFSAVRRVVAYLHWRSRC